MCAFPILPLRKITALFALVCIFCDDKNAPLENTLVLKFKKKMKL